MGRYFINLCYKGTRYHGWQRQKNAVTVQEEVEKALHTLTGENITITGAGRTDAGVHARVFYAHFDTDLLPGGEAKEKFIFQMNGILPRDIMIVDLIRVNDNAHARFNAVSRTYRYYICTSKNPFYEGQAFPFHAQPDIELMNQGAEIISKHTDFSCFSKSGTTTKTNNCKIFEAYWYRDGDLIIFHIKADRFLRNMVRAVAGTLLEIGMHKLPIEEIENIISSKNRSKAGTSLPAEGLFLERIEYPADLFHYYS